MKHVDMRKLPAAAQEERRRQVIGLRERGLTYAAIAAQVGLSRTGVFDICKRFAAERQGAGEPAARAQAQRAAAARCGPGGSGAAAHPGIRRTSWGCRLPWETGQQLRGDPARCGVVTAIRTVGKYLARWGFTAQKPLRRAYEQNPAAVRCWLRRDYPAIVAAARRAHGTVFWGDETGLRSDDVRGRGDAPRGRTPVVRVCHRRAGLSLISAVSNRGALRWMVLDGAVNAAALIRFLQRLIRDVRRKVFSVLDRLQVHRAGQIRDWLAAHRTKIEVFYLPAYSPELNPDEGLNADLKQAVTRKPPARSKHDLKRSVISHMRRLSQSPSRIRSYFRHEPVRYAA